MRQALLILFLLALAPFVSAETTVNITGPQEVVPGQTVTYAVETQIDGIRVLSLPVEMSLVWPDQTTTQLTPQEDGQGMYESQIYLPRQGEYTLQATVRIAQETYTQEKTISVRPPPLPATITRQGDQIRVVSNQSISYEIREVPLRAGLITNNQPVCSFTCETCNQTCPAQTPIIHISATAGYSYTQLLADETHELFIQAGETINTTGWFVYQNNALTRLADQVSFSEDRTLIDSQSRIQQLSVIESSDEVITLNPAYSVLDGQWYARYQQSPPGVITLNHTIRDAWTLNGLLLNHTKSTLQTSSPFEVLLDMRGQAALPRTQRTSYGLQVQNVTDLLRMPADGIALSLNGPAALPVHTDASGQEVYYADRDHVVLPGRLSSTRERLTRAHQSVNLSDQPLAEAVIILDENLEVVYRQQEAMSQWTPRTQPGRYFVLHQADQQVIDVVDVLADGELIRVSEANKYSAQQNTQLIIKKTIQNTDTSPRTIDVLIDSPSRVTLSSGGSRLTDSNLNGVPDTGILAPGEQVEVSATVYISPNAQDHEVSWMLSHQEAATNVTDTIRIIDQLAALEKEDIEISRISSQETIIVHINNYFSTPRTQRLKLTYYTDSGVDEDSYSLTLPVGASTHEFVAAPNTHTVTAEVDVEDANIENNKRILYRSSDAQTYAHVSEQYGIDHDSYRVKIRIPNSQLRPFYTAANDTLVETRMAVIEETPQYKDVIVELELDAYTDSQILMRPGAADSFDPYEIIDERQAQQRGRWIESSQVSGAYANNYLVDLNERKGDLLVEYTPSQPGTYEVESWYPADELFASNTRIIVAGNTILADQQVPARWKYLGRYTFSEDDSVVVSNAATDGMVVADAFRFLRVDAYSSLIQDSTPPGQARGLIFDSAGREVNARITLREDGQVSRAGLLPRQAQANNKNYEILFDFEDGPVDNVRVHNANPSAMGLGLERVPPGRAQQFTARNVADSFAIDPQFDSDYSFTRTATGRELLKCTEYDFENQECMGEFEHVMFITPGQEYTATLDPRDPLFIEVTDEVIPPIHALCSDSSGESTNLEDGNWDESVCAGTYTPDPSCGPGGARVLCDDSNTEFFDNVREEVLGIDAQYADVNRDPIEQCDNILSVSLEYRWDSPTNNVNNRFVQISLDNGTSFAGTGCPTGDGLQSCDVSGFTTWACEDFFGEETETRARLAGYRTGGQPGNPTQLEIPYLVFIVDFDFEIQPFTSDSSNYVQGRTVTFSGADVWDANEDVRINITYDGSLIDQVDVTTDAQGEFNATYQLDSYASLGQWVADVWQLSNASIEYQRNFTVNLRNPQITAERVGNYYNRSETVIFSGSQWVNNATVLVSVTGPEDDEIIISPDTNVTSPTGELEFHWQIPEDLDLLTGPYTFSFVEEDNSSYSSTDIVEVVILPSSATRHDGADMLDNIYRRDNTYARFIGDDSGENFISVDFPPAAPTTGITLSNISLEFFHRQESGAEDLHVKWFNPDTSAWETIPECVYEANTSARWDVCDLMPYVGTNEYFNDVQIRFSEDGVTSGGQTSDNFDFDIAFLNVNFTFPPPIVNLLAPPDSSWFNTVSHELFYEANNSLFGISECRVYIDETLEYTNDTFVTNSTDSYTHTFTEGIHTWRAECTDDSARQLVGVSQVWDIFIDLTPPSTVINEPGVDEWLNISDAEVVFTLTDNLADPINWSIYLDGSLDDSGVAANNTAYTHTFNSLADGYYEATVEAWDVAMNFADNESVTFYVDTTPPVITLNDPVDTFNTSSTSVEFSWTPTDNLAPELSCDLFVDDVLQASFLTTNGAQNQTTIPGFSDGLYNWSVACTDLAGWTTLSDVREFTVDTTPPVVQLEAPLDQSLFTTTRDVQLDYNVTDNLLEVTECRLYVDDELNQTDTSISQGVTQSFFLTDLDLGVYSWNVACIDSVGNADNSTQWSFEVNVSVFAQSPANGFVIDRENSGFASESITLVANASDGASGVSVDFFANLTQPSIAGQENLLLGSNLTGADGLATFTFNPDSTFFAGNYSWWPTANRYYNDSPRDFVIFGTPSIVFQDALFDPNEEYNASQTVTINTTVTSPGPESASQLDALYMLFANATIIAPDAEEFFATLSGVENLSGTYTLSATPSIGLWDVFANTSASYFFMTNTSTREFLVKGPANALEPANNTRVDRDGAGPDSETIRLVMQIPRASAGNMVNFTADLISPGIAGQNSLLLGQNTTNATGHAVLDFTPDTSYFAGEYVWRAESDISFVNEQKTFIIVGGVDIKRSSSTILPASEYNQSDTAEFHVNITSSVESQEQLATLYGISGNVTFTPNFTASPIYTPSLSWSGANWTTTQSISLTDPVGTWKFTSNASGIYHYENTSIEYFLTVLGLSSLSIDTADGLVYETINFTANYSDTLNQPISYTDTQCEIRFDILGGYTAYENMNYDSSSGLFWFSRSFNETYTNAEYNVICDDPLYESQNVTDTFNINKTFVDMLTTPGQIVDRDGAGPDSETLLLQASIPQAPAGVTISFYTNLTDPLLGQTEVLLGSNTTNSSGVAVYTWNPDSTIRAGNHTLYANATYADTRDLSDAQVFASLQALFTSPTINPAINYTQNETITIQANATTAGLETPSQLDTNYALLYTSYLESVNGVDTTSLTFLDPIWQSTYTLLDLAGVGVWNVSINASANYHYPDSSIRSFDVFGYMNVTESSIDPIEHFVYGSATQTCTVRDQHTDVAVQGAQVFFYRNATLVGSNTTNASGVGELTFQTNSSGVFDVVCEVQDQLGIYYFSGDQPNSTNSLTVLPFPITPTSPVNGTLVDRDETNASVANDIELVVNVPSYVPDGTVIEFYSNFTDPLTGSAVLLGSNVTQSGVAYLTYNPATSSYAGLHEWYAINPDGISNGTRTYTSIMSPEIVFANSLLNPNTNYTQNESATLQANLTSPGPELRTQLANEYSSLLNFTLSSQNGEEVTVSAYADPLWQSTYNLLDLAGVGLWNVTASSVGDYQFDATSSLRTFEVYGFMNITESSIDPIEHFVYGSATQTCTVRDQHTDVAVQGAQVFFYRNATLVGTNTTNSTGQAEFTFQTNSSGVFDVVCEVQDQLGIYYFAGDDPTSTNSLTVLPFPITPTSPVNGTLVDRDETNASVSNTIELVVEVPSYVPDGTVIEFYSNLTDPFSESAILLGSNTTSSGTARLTYNPSTASYAGLHEWYATNPDGSINGTRTYTSIMSPEIVFANSLFNPNLNYTQNESATLHTNLTSPGPETRINLSANYFSLVNYTLVSQNGQEEIVAGFANPLWQSTYNLLDLAGVGIWNVTASSVGDYQFDATSSLRIFEVYGYMNLTQASLDSTSTHVYGFSTQTCSVQDQHTSVAIQDAQVFFYQNTTLLGSNTTNSSGVAEFTFQTNNTGVYEILCEVQDQLGIYYFAGDIPNASNTLTITPFPITPINPVNDTLVDRDESNTSVSNTIELIVEVPSYVPDAVTINFTSALIDPLTQAPVILGSNTTSSGTARLLYNPSTSSYAGLYVWNASSTNGFTNGSRTYQSIGTTNATFFDELLFPQSTYEQNDSSTLRANLTTAGPETRTQLAINYSSLLNFTLNSMNGADTTAAAYVDPYWQSTYNLLDLTGVGVWNISANTKTNYFFNSLSEQRNFTVYGYMNLTETSPTNPLAYEYVSHTQTCTVRDQHTSVAIQDAEVFFYRNTTLLGTNTTNSSGQASFSFATNTSGTYDLLCEVQDQLAIYYYTGDDPSQTTTLTVEPFLVTPTAPANNTLVDRDGFLATPNTITLNVSVVEEIPEGVTIYFYANLTNPVVAGEEEILLGTNTTTSDNWASLTYNPNSTTYLGDYVWWAQGGERGANGTRTFTQLGSLNITFANTTINPNAEYDKPVNVTIDALIQSYGPETNDQLANLYAASTNNTFIIPNGTTDTISLAYNTVNWSGEYEIQIPDTRGWWTAQLNASANYFTLNNAASRQFFVNNFPPTHDTPMLNASDDPFNLTTANLTVHPQNVSDPEEDPVVNMTDWRIQNQSIAVLNLPLLSNENSTQSGAIRDYTTYEHNATLGGGSAANTPSFLDSCVIGGCYEFINQDYIDTTLTLNPGLTSWSISLWARIDSLPSDTGASVPIIQQEDGSGIGRTLLGLSSNDDSWYSFYGGNFEDSGVVPTLGQWYHVTYTYNLLSENLTYYVDATQIFTTQVSPEQADGIWTIARHKSNANEFHGSLDHIMVFDRRISQEQITQIRQDGLAGKPPKTIVSQETNKEEVWTSCLTPNDGLDDGQTLCSNELRIRGLLQAISPANDTVIDRDGFSTDSETINLSAYTFGDANINVSFYANLTDPSYAGQNNILLGYAISNESGIATLTYDPDSSIYAGNYTWKPIEENSTTQNNRTYLVYGSLQATYNSSVDPNDEYNQTDTALFVLNLTSLGPETPADINTTQNFSLNQILTQPNSTNITITPTLNDSLFISNYTFLAPETVGVYNTSVAASARFFYSLTQQLRNFTLRGVSTIDVFDTQDINPRTIWASTPAEHYANWTHLDDSPIQQGICTLTLWDGEQKNLTYQPSTQLWAVNHSYDFAGIFRYNVSCQQEFYYDVFGQNNISIATNVSLLANYSTTQLANSQREVLLEVTNLKNHTEGNITLYTVLDNSLTASYDELPTTTQQISGEYTGSVLEWYISSLEPNSSYQVRFNVTGSGMFSNNEIIGVRTPPVSGEVFG